MTRRPKQPLPTENLVPSATDANAIVQVKVWLLGISPMVWRRVLVPSACTLRERLDALTAKLDQSRGGAQVSQERAEAVERADDARRPGAAQGGDPDAPVQGFLRLQRGEIQLSAKRVSWYFRADVRRTRDQ
jgi:hypothetical protein